MWHYSINVYIAPEDNEDGYPQFWVLLIEMLTREEPTGSIETLMKSVQSYFVPLITSCTVTDPNQRPSMRQVIDQLDTIIM